ncbi:glycosyltransferase [Fontisphaera persica]|uniref:glycosyltransferase n=1 Tax=Fontisphaera persica TaxID=2974023 RepID=UPI0024C04294|nr:glycosyltransferase [Fontisphaera persica]WCJ59509.1 glycosyltransferase [Fontisphaera persica]
MLIAYNQEQFIREAVEGAFAQTYSPLEIILSDDCSTDRTFEIMKEMSAQYKGPHRIILNRNERNLGICSHVNRCVELTHGELIVCAAGDDISIPGRTSYLAGKWLDFRKAGLALMTNASVINDKGEHIQLMRTDMMNPFVYDIDSMLRGDQFLTFGCTMAYTRDLFTTFGPLSKMGIKEDIRLGFRSILIGELRYFPDVLVFKEGIIITLIS